MNRTFIITALTFAASLFALVSCSDTDSESIVPQFDAINCEPASPAPGDSIVLTAHQSVRGKLIYSATYRWTFTYTDGETQRDTTVARQSQVVYDAEGGNVDPQMGFRVPADIVGWRLTVALNASYGLSGQTAQGQIFGQASRSTTIRIAQ